MTYVKKNFTESRKSKTINTDAQAQQIFKFKFKRKLQVYNNNEQYETGTNKTVL